MAHGREFVRSTAGRYLGQDLSDEETWRRLMQEIERIIYRVVADGKRAQPVPSGVESR